MPDGELARPCGCPILAFQAMISGKYKVRILWDLKDGPRRYGEIRTGLLRGSIGAKEGWTVLRAAPRAPRSTARSRGSTSMPAWRCRTSTAAS
jgi:hypothetical protein